MCLVVGVGGEQWSWGDVTYRFRVRCRGWTVTLRCGSQSCTSCPSLWSCWPLCPRYPKTHQTYQLFVICLKSGMLESCNTDLLLLIKKYCLYSLFKIKLSCSLHDKKIIIISAMYHTDLLSNQTLKCFLFIAYNMFILLWDFFFWDVL